VLFGCKKRLQVVVPGFKVFPHSMREAWALNLKQMGASFDWIVHREGQPERTAKKIRPESLVFLLNDHHLDDLTSYLCEQGKYGRGRDGGIWVGLATEKVVDSIFPRSEEKTRLCANLCHLVAHFDPKAGPILLDAGAQPFFCHQYADAETFRSRLEYSSKNNGIFWAGKLRVGDFTEAYRERTLLFEGIRQTAGFVWREAANPEKGIGHIVREKDGYKGLLNLPSNCPGFTSNFFENLAMGGCVFQHDVSSSHPEGLEPGAHYLAYRRDQPESLREVCGRFLRDPGQYREMARRGHEACLRAHTLKIRIREIFAALSQGMESWSASRVAKELLGGVVGRALSAP